MKKNKNRYKGSCAVLYFDRVNLNFLHYDCWLIKLKLFDLGIYLCAICEIKTLFLHKLNFLWY